MTPKPNKPRPPFAPLVPFAALAAATVAAAVPQPFAFADTPTKPSPDELARVFAADPPQSAQPQTWWHWLNGNVTREGITADLEAMKRVGVGGAEIFNVDQGIPLGKYPMMSPQWFEMVKFAESEAKRLHLELCVHNGGGWSSSGGPWITPEYAMQQVVSSEQSVTGETHFSGVLPKPPTKAGFYRDIAVIAVPAPPSGAPAAPIADLRVKADFESGRNITPDTGKDAKGSADFAVAVGREIDLTARMTADGHLDWDAPAGQWTVLRIGYTPTGAMNEPSPQSGLGLECDKLSKKALDVHFAGMVQKILDDRGPELSGKNGSLDDVLIDSYEVGSQNWTPAFREEFRRRRGYDLMSYLPVLTGRVVESRAVSERFLWDFRRTITDLFTENYYEHFAELCHARGLKFSTEAYGNGPFDELACGGKADIPMAEFWVGGAAEETAKLASSSAHTYGHTYAGAESFTSEPSHEKNTVVPYDLKSQGDRMFCAGINRFIFHRYAMQPWTNRAPGMTMGPWGIHFERTNTWWNQGAAWLKYVGRSQYLLQQGTFVADVAYFSGDNAPIGLMTGDPPLPAGYDYDGISQEILRDQMIVKDGMLALPSGMRYRVLVLPNNVTMTPETLRKIRQLVMDGATIVGREPTMSPSLQNYPACDYQVFQMANDLWGHVQGPQIDNAFGKGRVIWNSATNSISLALNSLHVAPDFTAQSAGKPAFGIHYIHRAIGASDAYLVASQWNAARAIDATFRVGSDKTPYLYHADTGAIEPAPVFTQTADRTTIPLRFEPSGSVFVVFQPRRGRGGNSADTQIVHVEEAPTQRTAAGPRPTLVINRAVYAPVDGVGGSADVTDRVAAQVEEGTLLMPISNDALGGDPSLNHVKRLRVEYTLNGVPGTADVGENETLEITNPIAGGVGTPPARLSRDSKGAYSLEAWQPGTVDLQQASGRHVTVNFSPLPDALPIDGAWTLNFPPNLGAPPTVQMPTLASWTENDDAGVRYFSGTATYVKDIDVPANLVGVHRNLYLDLGQIKNIAQVRLNGVDLGILWKPPYRANLTNAVHAGMNHLEVEITNLWPNRLIGDLQLPDDADWDGDHLRSWPQWVWENKPSPTGHIAFTTWRHWKKDDPLLPSGLLGPVRLVPSVTVSVDGKLSRP